LRILVRKSKDFFASISKGVVDRTLVIAAKGYWEITVWVQQRGAPEGVG
jgi:hypothetical protein